MHSVDGVAQNVERIAELFPNCVTERLGEDGNVERAVDFDKLRQELSRDVVEGNEERYQFTWPGKREAIRLANTPTNCTLRPVREDSVNFDTTQNLFIEGDNLEVLKLLRETYLGKVKMIYIDPPYNTGSDFVYEDDFAQSYEDYKGKSGMFDEDGNMLLDNYERNTETNGRFHTDWLNLMYPRLKVARDLLSEDGVIFISIDDNEAKNLKNLTDEIFGPNNFLAQVVWERAFSPINLMKHFSPSHDYVLVYAKNPELAICNGIPRSKEANDRYSNPDNDPRGVWMSSDISVGPAVAENIYPITTPSGRIVEPPAGRSWRLSRNAFRERLQDNRIWFGPDGDGVPRIKRFLSELRKTGITPMTIWKYEEVGHSQEATQSLAKLFGGKKYFDYPKPVGLIKRIISLYSQKESIILDFFSGSGTTAQSVFELNADDNGTRKFILVQLPEKTDDGSPAQKDGFNNICDIAKERIRLAGKKVKEEAGLMAQGLDIGFRVLRLDSSNMEEVYYTPDKFDPNAIQGFIDNVKADRTDEDLLFQVMLEHDIPLSASIKKEQIAGKNVFNVADGHLIATFDNDVNETTVTEIAKQQPNYFVMRDASAANDNVLDNFEQIFRHYSPDTICKIL